MYHNTLENTAL